MSMLKAKARYPFLLGVFATLALGSCTSVGPMQPTSSTQCSTDDPLNMVRFVDNWNSQNKLQEAWGLESSKIKPDGRLRTVSVCDDGELLCAKIQYAGECVLSADVDAFQTTYNSLRGLSQDFERRIIWSKLIQSFEPNLSKSERDRLDTALYVNLRADDPTSTSTGQTDIIKYTSSYKEEQFILTAAPLKRSGGN